MSSLIYLSRKEIDNHKWDFCIKNAENGLIYARTFFLDNMAIDWDALVMGDYELVMPLVWRKKFGITYLYQPYFTAQLGIFGNIISTETVELFLQNIPKKFTYIDIDLNEGNQLDSRAIKRLDTRMRFSTRANYMLPASNSNQGYHRLAGRMLNKAGAANVRVLAETDAQKLISFYQEHYARRHSRIDASTYAHLTRTAKIAFKSGLCNLYIAELRNTSVAVYLVMNDEKYFYSVLGGSSDEGKEVGAFYALTDAAIHDAGKSGKIFRFEGSDIPGIASFNAQFGAIKQSYLHLKYNNLPMLVRWLK